MSWWFDYLLKCSRLVAAAVEYVAPNQAQPKVRSRSTLPNRRVDWMSLTRSFEFARWWWSPLPGTPAVGVLDRQTCQGGTWGNRLCGEDRDRETENSKVCTRTRDTRFIQVRAAKVTNPTSCLGDQVWRLALGVGLSSGAQLGIRPSFI
jgi:hypothetical protein